MCDITWTGTDGLIGMKKNRIPLKTGKKREIKKKRKRKEEKEKGKGKGIRKREKENSVQA